MSSSLSPRKVQAILQWDSGYSTSFFPPPSFHKPGSLRFTHSGVVHTWEAKATNHVSQTLRGGGGVFRNILDPAGCHGGSACIWSRLIIESAATVIKVANHTTPLKHKFFAAVVLRNYPVSQCCSSDSVEEML